MSGESLEYHTATSPVSNLVMLISHKVVVVNCISSPFNIDV